MKESKQYIIMDGCMYLNKCPTKIFGGGGGGGGGGRVAGEKTLGCTCTKTTETTHTGQTKVLFQTLFTEAVWSISVPTLPSQHDQSMYQHCQVSMINQCTNTAKPTWSINVPTLPSQHVQSMYQYCQANMIKQCTNTAKSACSNNVPTLPSQHDQSMYQYCQANMINQCTNSQILKWTRQ